MSEQYKPLHQNNDKLTKVVRDMLRVNDDGIPVIVKCFNVALEDGSIETLSFNEIEGVINIMDLSRPLPTEVDAISWIILTYGLEDLKALLKDDWVITEYKLSFEKYSRVMIFTGKLKHGSEIPSHPRYNREVSVGNAKVFEFKLESFDVIQQAAISRIIAGMNKQLNVVAGTIDMSFDFSFSPSGINYVCTDEEETE